MAKQSMLTTIDNPFNPFEDFTSWFDYDVEKGYYSCSKLARLTRNEDDMSSAEVDADIERAIDEIIKHDFTNMYTRVQQEST